jgi:hypothetical protein
MRRDEVFRLAVRSLKGTHNPLVAGSRPARPTKAHQSACMTSADA